MKKTIVLATALISLAACQKRNVKKIENHLTQGTWKVTGFLHDGTNQTVNYTGETFVFYANGVVQASGTQTVNGAWNVKKESKGDDDLFDDRHLEFNLSFAGAHSSLSRSWEVEQYSDHKLVLKEDDDHEDMLIFEKE